MSKSGNGIDMKFFNNGNNCGRAGEESLIE